MTEQKRPLYVRPAALDEQKAIDLERWYSEVERLGTVRKKCEELGITPHTLYDAIRRVRGQDHRLTRQKVAAFRQTLTVISVGQPAQIVEEEADKTTS